MMYLKTYVIMIVGLVLWLNCEAQIPAVSMTSMNHPGIDDNYVLAEMLNSVGGNNQGLVLTNPRYIAEFTKNSVKFSPSSNAPEFIWSLSGGAPVLPVLDNNKVVYQRGNISEEYLLKANTIEQQFIVHDPSVAKHGIVIAGKVMCDGKFSETHDGWTWKNGYGEVTLSDVFVFDANKTRLPAQMTVTENSTTIEVSAEHLEGAVFPITIDPEIGTNDYRISTFGSDGDIGFQAKNASISYSSTTNKYLVVWEGNIGGENEIYGQLLNGTTGEPEGSEIMISNMGPSGNTAYDATNPDVASSGDEFFVVWQADDNTNPLIDNEFEIYGQRINGSSGALISSRVRISDMGTDGDANYGAFSPAITYNSIGNGGNPEYFVVWSGDDNTGSLADNEFEIYGQRLSLTGDESGFSNDVRLSDLGVDGFDLWQAFEPDVAWNSTSNQYLVTWYGDDNIFPLAVDENEIFIQRLTSTGASTGSNDIRVSFAGPNGDTNYSSVNPAIAYNSVDNNYLVVWYGDDDTAPLVDNENEIHGTIISNIGAIGTSLRISDMGPDGNANYDALNPAVAHDPFLNQFLVNWKGDDNSSTLVDNEFEIFVQLVTGIGAESGIDTRLSDVGGTGNITYNAFRPAIVYNSTMREFINNWYADENIGSLANNEYEIWGQRFAEMDVEPTAQASSFTPSLITQSSFTVSFSAATGTPDAYIALRKSGSSPTDIPIDQQGYSIGDPIGASTVAYVGSSLTFSESGLLSNTTYYYDIFSFNGVNSSSNYRTTTPLEGNATTLAAEPSTQATAISFSNLGTNSINVDFVGGNGTSSLLVGRAGSAVNNFPQDGNGYTTNTVFGLGSNLGSSNFVLAAGSGPFTITGLSAATEYYFRVFEFNGSGSLANYNVSAATGNPSSIFTLSPQPANQPTALNLDNFTVNSMTGSFTAAAGNPDGYIVLRKAGSVPTSVPVNGTIYSAGNLIGDGTVVSTGSSTFFNSTGLSPDTDYYYKIYSYNGSGTTVNFLTASPLGGNATTLATEPSAQPTLLTFNTITSSSMTGAFIAASGTPDGYIAFRKSGLSPTDVPVDGNTYLVGNTIGTSTVAYVGSALTFNDPGLSANTTYHYDIFSYNGVNAATNYRTVSPLEGNRTTLTSEPSIQATAIIFSSLETNRVTIDFTDGNGTSRLVVAKAGSAVDNFPVDGNSYVANPAFGSGSDLGSFNYVVGEGSGPFTITGLSIAVEYHFFVVEFNGTGGLENYNIATATGNPSSISTLATAPTAQPTALTFNSITDTAINGSFVAASGNPTGYIVLGKAGSAPTGTPVNGTIYSAGDAVGDATVVFTGSNTTFVNTGLSPETVYHYAVFSYNGSGAAVIFLTGSPLEGNATTLATESSAQPSLLSFSAVTSTSMTGSYTAATGAPNGYIVLRKSGSSPTDIPVDGTAYSSGNTIGTSTVAFVGNALTFIETNLSANTTYYYDIFSYNGANTATNYLVAAPLEGNRTTLASEPATQGFDIVFSGLETNEITLGFTDGDGTSRLVVAKEGSAVDNFPVDGITYTANSIFGSGSDLGSSSFVVGTGSGPFTITGLSGATQYHFNIFEFNGSAGLENYNVAAATGNPSVISTLALEPASQPTELTFSDITTSSMTGSFTAAADNPAGYLVLRKEGSAPTETPSDGISYAINDNIGTSLVIYVGNDISFPSSGLNAGTVYHYAVFSSNGTGATLNYFVSDPLENSVITISPAPEVLDPTQIAPTSFTAPWNASAGATHYVLDVSADDFSTFVPGYDGKEVTTGLEEAVTGLNPNTTYKYRVRAVNLSGVSANSLDKSVTTLEESSASPLQISTPVVKKNENGYTISVSLSSGSGTHVVSFYSRGIIDQNFIESELTSTTDTYQATVLDTELDELGLEFYFTATDDLTTTPLTSAGFIYREIVVNQTSISGLSSGGMKENYRMVSIPYTLEDNLVQSIFGVLGEYDNSKWRLIRYQNGKNVDFPAFNRIVNGQGYWFNSLEPVEIKMGAGTVPNYNQQNPFTLTLTKGWNQVGAPYPFDINWSDVQDANPGATISSLKVYQPTSLSFTENDNLKVWSGGFVFADNSVQISFPVTLKTSAGSRKTGKIANVIERGLLDDKEWFVPLRLTHGKAENSMIGFGMHPDASESKDKYDDITLPRFFNYLEMNSEHSEFFAPLFTKDVVPAATQYRWKFVMQSNFEGETASLEWDPDRFGNNNSMLLLYDASEQRFINMKSNSNYEFDFRNSKQFEFIYSFDRESWQSDFTLLGLPYPNPVMETVNIPLIVKDQEEVSVEILDIMGRGVKNLFKGTPSGGTQTITWDRTNESNVRVGPGVYLVNLVSGRYRQVKKIIVK